MRTAHPGAVILYWRIGQFPELEHLPPDARRRALARVPRLLYFHLAASSLIIGFMVAIFALVVIDGMMGAPKGKLAFLPTWLIATIATYLFHIRWVYIRMRNALRSITRGQRPPFCLGCNYDLTGSTADRCPECGKPLPAYAPG